MKARIAPSALFWSALAAAVGLFLVLALSPSLPCIGVIVPGYVRVYIVSHPVLNLLMAGAALLAPALCLSALRRLPCEDGASRAQNVVFPLAFLPCSFLGILVMRIPVPIAANVAFFLPLAIGAYVLNRAASVYAPALNRTSARRWFWVLLAALTLAYGVAGYRIFLRVGEHYVDEGHYIVQMTSLREDGDLDLRNNLGLDLDAAVAGALKTRDVPPERLDQERASIVDEIKADLHISPNSPGGRWYSWHPWGLPVLLTPFYALGPLPRHLGIGLFSALGCVVAFLLCVRCGNSRTASLIVAVLTAVSTYWFTYSTRCLPETLGATLFACAVYAAHLFALQPRRALLLFVAAAAYLPCVHIRFAPCSALAAGYFVLQTGLLARGCRVARRAPVAIGLAVTAAAAVVAGLLWTYPGLVNRALLYPTQDVLLAYPEGMWLSLFSNRGLFYSFPLGMFLIAAVPVAAFTDGPSRRLHLLALLTLLALLVTSGASDCWDGGPTLAGRYLLVLIPITLPAAAHVYDRSLAWGRGWILFLGLYSAAFFAIALAQLARLPRDFLHLPRYTIKYCLPLLRDLFAPYQISDLLIGHPYRGLAALTEQVFPLVFFLVTVVFVMVRPLRKSLAAALLVAFVVFGVVQHRAHNTAGEPWQPDWIEYAWATVATPQARTVQCPGGNAFPLARFSNRFAAFAPITITAGAAADPGEAIHASQPQIDATGCEVAGQRWLEVAPGFRAGETGPRLLRIRGRQDGDGILHIAVCHGGRMLLDERVTAGESGAFDYARVLHYTRGAGNVRILARLEGATGSIRLEALQWTPVSRLEAADYQ